jgi:hypothetical protein
MMRMRGDFDIYIFTAKNAKSPRKMKAERKLGGLGDLAVYFEN